jgi:glucosamine kinase
MAYYLGIDGGGTKTRCVLANETTVLATAMSGGSNIVRLGEKQAKEALLAAFHQVCGTANILPNQIQSVCMGAAGAARPEIVTKIREMLAALMPEISRANIEVVGDTVIALEAAFGTGPGVIAIAGTGSIVYGRNANSEIARAGGWGFAISDEGSGHWIGRSAISAVVTSHDQGHETVLEGMLLEAWKLRTLDELVQQANSTPPPDFPRLFPIVLRAAAEDDTTARDILTDAGEKLAALAAAVVHRLASPATSDVLPVAMTGSVFRQSPEVRQVFYNRLQTTFPGIEMRKELADPVEGALARARRIVEKTGP